MTPVSYNLVLILFHRTDSSAGLRPGTVEIFGYKDMTSLSGSSLLLIAEGHFAVSDVTGYCKFLAGDFGLGMGSWLGRGGPLTWGGASLPRVSCEEPGLSPLSPWEQQRKKNK